MMENLYLDNADNALQNYLNNDSYRDKKYDRVLRFGFL